MKKIYTSPSFVEAKTRLRASILAGSNETRPDGTPYPENIEGISGNGGPTNGFDARKRFFSMN